MSLLIEDLARDRMRQIQRDSEQATAGPRARDGAAVGQARPDRRGSLIGCGGTSRVAAPVSDRHTISSPTRPPIRLTDRRAFGCSLGVSSTGRLGCVQAAQ